MSLLVFNSKGIGLFMRGRKYVLMLLVLLCVLPTLLLSSTFSAGSAMAKPQSTATASSSSEGLPLNGLQQLGEMWSQLWSRQQKVKASEEANKGTLGDFSIIPESDIRDKNRTIWIITTASLPWMTGTSINPLLRAAYLAKDRPAGKVHLMVPWLEKEEQAIAFAPGVRFDTPEEQKQYVMNWLRHDAHLPLAADRLQLHFYTGRYHDEFHSIFPMGDIAALIPDDLADICILEEPEHLNWFKAPFEGEKTWTEKFQLVIGIIHTNYIMYARTHTMGQITSPLLQFLNQGMCRAYCHKIIKLSGTLQEFAPEKEVISNVHGVREKYLSIGDSALSRRFRKGAYFVGKMAWPKGLDELFRYMNYVSKRTGKCFPIDIYGQGPHLQDIKDTAKKMKLPTSFFGAKDHAQLSDYKVFVNPSLSEVLCTTIVEALAMGKWVVCPKHPSNEFFEQFPNTLLYTNEEEFAANVYWALHHDPHPLTSAQRHSLSWEAATERLIAASTITRDMQYRSNKFTDKFIGWMLEAMGSHKYGDTIRLLAGGRAASNQIEFMNLYGTSAPRGPSTANNQVDNSHENILEGERVRVQDEKLFKEEWNQMASDFKNSMTSDPVGEANQPAAV